MTHGNRVGAVVLLALLSGVACQQIRDSPSQGLEGTVITFSINVDESERAAIEELIESFELQTRQSADVRQLSRFRKPLGAKVNLITDTTAEGLVNRLEADKLAGRPTVHLFAQDNVALTSLVDQELVQDLEELKELAPVLTEAIDTSVAPLDSSVNRYFLPFRPNVRLAYGRHAAFEQAGVPVPRTEEELVSAARALKGDDRDPKVTLSLAPGAPATVTVCEFILAHGGNPLVLNDAGSVAAFTFLQRLWREGLLAPESFLAKFDTEVDNLLDGTASLAQNWSFTSAQLANASQLRDFSVYPGWNGVHVIGGDVIGIPQGVRDKELRVAVDLAEFLLRRESQELLVRRNSWPSFRNDVGYRNLPPEQKDTFDAIQTALENGWYRPAVPYWSDLDERINRAVLMILQEGAPVQPVLDGLHGELEAMAARKGFDYP